eukprot:scaffold7066_cov253-Pinguiococcus_pyrenoidosus.AAC.29
MSGCPARPATNSGRPEEVDDVANRILDRHFICRYRRPPRLSLTVARSNQCACLQRSRGRRGKVSHECCSERAKV